MKTVAALPPAHPQPERFALGVTRRNNLLREALTTGNVELAYKGRGAIHRLIRAVPRSFGNTVLMPAFHCPTMVEPVLAAGRRVLFYDVDSGLNPRLGSVASSLTDDVAVVVLTRYFGFSPAVDAMRDLMAGHECILLEDCAHSFLSADPLRLSGGAADAAVYSFWKLVPSLVGAGLSVHHPALETPPATRPLPYRAWFGYWRELASALLRAGSARAARVPAVDGEDRLLVPETLPRAPTLDDYPFDEVLAWSDCPWPARYMIEHADLAEICRRRRRNFAVALDMLMGLPGVEPVFRELPDDVCPWAFPVVIGERADTDFRLRARGVPLFTFGETMHPALTAPDAFPLAAHFRRNLIALAVHQGLDEDDVARYCEIIRRFVKCRIAGVRAGKVVGGTNVNAVGLGDGGHRGDAA